MESIRYLWGKKGRVGLGLGLGGLIGGYFWAPLWFLMALGVVLFFLDFVWKWLRGVVGREA